MRDTFRPKARHLAFELWIQKGPTVQGGGRLRMVKSPSSGELNYTLEEECSQEQDPRAVHDFVYLDMCKLRMVDKSWTELTTDSGTDLCCTSQLHYDLLTDKHDIVNELQQVFGHTVQEEDEGVKDEFHSLFDAYGLKNATIEAFDIVPIKKSPTHWSITGRFTEPVTHTIVLMLLLAQ